MIGPRRVFFWWLVSGNVVHAVHTRKEVSLMNKGVKDEEGPGWAENAIFLSHRVK